MAAKILVDADACPVVRIVEQVAKKYEIEVIFLCDTNHVITSDYSEVKVIGTSADEVQRYRRLIERYLWDSIFV